jgi:hypothetical protein
MVQVDVFWSFAFGAGFAVSAAKQLEDDDKPLESRAFNKCLLWLALFFVPSGAYLLWAFPRWETMQVGTYATIPAWLVVLFTVTNITQGILGFWLTAYYLRLKKTFPAHLVGWIAWLIFWFILIHGWDGTGFKRFFYCGTSWSGTVTPWVFDTFHWYSPITWLVSPVAISLAVMGIIMLPFLFKWQTDMLAEGREIARNEGADIRQINYLLYLRAVAIDTLVAAIIASILIHWLGWIFGLLIFSPAIYFLTLQEGGFTYKALMPVKQ